MDIDEFLNLPYWRKAKGWYNLFKMAKNCAQNTEKGWEVRKRKIFWRVGGGGCVCFFVFVFLFFGGKDLHLFIY